MVTQQGLLTNMDWAQQPEKIDTKYLKKLKGEMLQPLASDCKAAQCNMHTVDCSLCNVTFSHRSKY